jgi:transcription initiation factor TFIID subunit 15
MVSSTLFVAFLASAGLLEASALHDFNGINVVARQQGVQGGRFGGQGKGQQFGGGQGNGQQGGGQGGQGNGQQGGGGQQGGQQGGATCLKTNVIQSASGLTGQEPGTEGIKAGQAPSAT